MFGNSLWLLIGVNGHVVFFGMPGYLNSAVVVTVNLLAASFGQLACLQLEGHLSAEPVDTSRDWTPPQYDVDDIALEMSDNPNISTDGSGEDFFSVGGFEVAGAGVYFPAAEVAFEGSVWGFAEEYEDARLERCRAFMPVPGVFSPSSVMSFGVPSLLCRPIGLDIGSFDNLNVTGTIGRLLDWCNLAKPLPLVEDGDLAALARYMICT